MTTVLAAMRSRWETLGKREKMVVWAAVCMAGVGLADLAFVEPLARSGKSSESALSAKRAELAQTVRQRQELSAEIDARKRLLEANEKKVDKAFSSLFEMGGLWRSALAQAWFEEMVSKHGRALTRFSISAEGMSDPGYPGLYAHVIDFEGEMDWPQIDALMAQLGRSKALRMKYIAISAIDAQGRLINVSAQAEVLSDERIWQPMRAAGPAAQGGGE